MSDIYQEVHIKKEIPINFCYLDKDIDKCILVKLKKLYENKCIQEGFVKDDSIELVKKGNGFMKNNDMLHISFNVLFKCMICNPLPNLVIKAKIVEIIKPGLIVYHFPISIIVPKHIHKNKSIFNKLKVDEEVEIKIIDIKFRINEKEIQGVAKLNSEKNINLHINDKEEDLNFELNDNSDTNISEDLSDNELMSDDSNDSDNSDDDSIIENDSDTSTIGDDSLNEDIKSLDDE